MLVGGIGANLHLYGKVYIASSPVNFWKWNFHPKCLGRNGDGSNPCTLGEHQIGVEETRIPKK